MSTRKRKGRICMSEEEKRLIEQKVCGTIREIRLEVKDGVDYKDMAVCSEPSSDCKCMVPSRLYAGEAGEARPANRTGGNLWTSQTHPVWKMFRATRHQVPEGESEHLMFKYGQHATGSGKTVSTAAVAWLNIFQKRYIEEWNNPDSYEPGGRWRTRLPPAIAVFTTIESSLAQQMSDDYTQEGRGVRLVLPGYNKSLFCNVLKKEEDEAYKSGPGLLVIHPVKNSKGAYVTLPLYKECLDEKEKFDEFKNALCNTHTIFATMQRWCKGDDSFASSFVHAMDRRYEYFNGDDSHHVKVREFFNDTASRIKLFVMDEYHENMILVPEINGSRRHPRDVFPDAYALAISGSGFDEHKKKHMICQTSFRHLMECDDAKNFVVENYKFVGRQTIRKDDGKTMVEMESLEDMERFFRWSDEGLEQALCNILENETTCGAALALLPYSKPRFGYDKRGGLSRATKHGQVNLFNIFHRQVEKISKVGTTILRPWLNTTFYKIKNEVDISEEEITNWKKIFQSLGQHWLNCIVEAVSKNDAGSEQQKESIAKVIDDVRKSLEIPNDGKLRLEPGNEKEFVTTYAFRIKEFYVSESVKGLKKSSPTKTEIVNALTRCGLVNVLLCKKSGTTGCDFKYISDILHWLAMSQALHMNQFVNNAIQAAGRALRCPRKNFIQIIKGKVSVIDHENEASKKSRFHWREFDMSKYHEKHGDDAVEFERDVILPYIRWAFQDYNASDEEIKGNIGREKDEYPDSFIPAKRGSKKPPKRKQTDENAEEGRLDAKMRYDHDDDLGVKDGLLGSARGLEGKTFGELLEKLSQQMSEFTGEPNGYENSISPRGESSSGVASSSGPAQPAYGSDSKLIDRSDSASE